MKILKKLKVLKVKTIKMVDCQDPLIDSIELKMCTECEHNDGFGYDFDKDCLEVFCNYNSKQDLEQEVDSN